MVVIGGLMDLMDFLDNKNLLKDSKLKAILKTIEEDVRLDQKRFLEYKDRTLKDLERKQKAFEYYMSRNHNDLVQENSVLYADNTTLSDRNRFLESENTKNENYILELEDSIEIYEEETQVSFEAIQKALKNNKPKEIVELAEHCELVSFV